MASELLNLSSSSYVSRSALANILKSLQEDPKLLQEAGSSSSLKRKRDDAVNVETPHGKVLHKLEVVDNDGNKQHIDACNVPALIWYLLRSEPLKKVFVEALRKNPSSVSVPWNIVLYTDEITPGNPLKATNKRKVWGVYATFKELGKKVMPSESGWFVVSLLRTDKAKTIGMSQVRVSVELPRHSCASLMVVSTLRPYIGPIYEIKTYTGDKVL